MKRITLNLFPLVLILFVHISTAQITTNALSNKVCLGDLTNFNYTPPSGVSIASYAWDFGNSFTSIGGTPSHIYKTTGKFTVKLVASKTGGGSITKTLQLEVLGLPKASFKFDPTSDSCLYDNEVCFKDLSLEANSGQSIVKRLVIWDDGSYGKKNTPIFGSSICHSYKKEDKYTISFEIADKYGCKDFVTRKINILPGVKAEFKNELSYPSCSKANVCITNKSKSSVNTGVSYEWNINGARSTIGHFSSPKCYSTNRYKKLIVSLKVKHTNGCEDSFKDTIHLLADTSIRKMSKSHSKICYGASNRPLFTINSLPGDEILWWINGEESKNTNDSIYLSQKGDSLVPGWHYIKCKITRGNCILELFDSIEVTGPVADFKIFNKNQCPLLGIKKVFLVNRSANVDSSKATFTWDVKDPNGDNCVIHREINQNKYKNCNTSKDWYAKHVYTDGSISVNPIKFTVTDNATGCSDSKTKSVNFRCGFC